MMVMWAALLWLLVAVTVAVPIGRAIANADKNIR